MLILNRGKICGIGVGSGGGGGGWGGERQAPPQ